MLEAFVQGLLSYGDLLVLGTLFVGMAIGIFIGIVPAIGGMVAVALLLPVAFTLPTVAAVSMLLAILVTSSIADSIGAILFGIPGSGPAAPTCVDGYPMTKKGEAGRALGGMLSSGTMGGILAVVLALIMIPLVRPLVLEFQSPEMFALIFMGISFIAVLGSEAPIKGMIAGFLGLLVGMIGVQWTTGAERYSFGFAYVQWGLPMLPVVLGLFAGAEMLSLAIFRESIVPASMAKVGKEFRRQIIDGMIEVPRRFLLLSLRSTIVGYIIGVIPGIGAMVGTWVAYAQAKQTCKNPEEFGTGRIEGVIGPEASQNAINGGALLTTLALGIPGSASMALILAALIAQGITPGPAMLRDELPLMFTLFWGLALAQIIGGVLNYIVMGYFNISKLISLHPRYLVPIVIALTYFGAYSATRQFGDLVLVLIFTVLGLGMKKYGFSRPAFLLGFILFIYFERYFFISVQTHGPEFFARPGVLIILVITAGLYAYEPLKALIARRRGGRT